MGIFACDLLSIDEEYKEYPTVYPALSISELQEMNNDFQQSNNGHLCSTLNRYGFTGFSDLFFVNGESPCSLRDVVRIEMTNTDTLVHAARRLLLADSIYTGVRDTTGLILKDMKPLPGCIICEGPEENRANIEYKLTFEEQVLDSIPVKNTEITVSIDAKGVNRIWGNWYSGFKKPEFVNFGYKQVRQELIGLQIDMRSYTGEETIYSVVEEDLVGIPQKVYMPVENEEEGWLEIRTCWQVKISPDYTDFPGWLAYIDVDEGYLVKLDQR